MSNVDLRRERSSAIICPPPAMHSMEYWEALDVLKIPLAQDYGQLYPIAENVLLNTPQPTTWICGPVPVGDFTPQKSGEMYGPAIEMICRTSIVFNQIPFDKRIWELTREDSYRRFPMRLVNEFYWRILDSGLISSLRFLYDWQNSVGARWLEEQARGMKIPVYYLDKRFNAYSRPFDY